MEEEFERSRATTKELRLWSEVYIPTDRLPIISAFHILLYQKSGRAHYLIVPHPESGADPISVFAVGYLAAIATKRVWEKGIELYLIAVTNSLEFVRGATPRQTTFYVVKRNQISDFGYPYTAEK